MIQSKKFLLIDGVGASTSAILLGGVIPQYQSFFGMPTDALYLLASLPCLFVIYDFTCYFKSSKRMPEQLQFIAFANAIYCILSIAFVIYFFEQLTEMGIAYFASEVSIILLLVNLELRAVKKDKSRRDSFI